MLRMKKKAQILLSSIIGVWCVLGLSEVLYSIYVILSCSEAARTHLHLVVIFNFIFFFFFAVGIRRFLFHFARIIEKKRDDLFVAHTLLGKYEFHKKDVFVYKWGKMWIDLYSCKISINKNDYIDCTSKKNFWSDFSGLH